MKSFSAWKNARKSLFSQIAISWANERVCVCILCIKHWQLYFAANVIWTQGTHGPCARICLCCRGMVHLLVLSIVIIGIWQFVYSQNISFQRFNSLLKCLFYRNVRIHWILEIYTRASHKQVTITSSRSRSTSSNSGNAHSTLFKFNWFNYYTQRNRIIDRFVASLGPFTHLHYSVI